MRTRKADVKKKADGCLTKTKDSQGARWSKKMLKSSWYKGATTKKKELYRKGAGSRGKSNKKEENNVPQQSILFVEQTVNG